MPHKVIDHDSDWLRNLVKRLRKSRTRLICERRSFKQPLDLSHLWSDIPIVVRHCWFREKVDLRGVRLRAGLTFERCLFSKGLDISDALIEGRLDFRRSVFHPQPSDHDHDQLVAGAGLAGPALLAFRLEVSGHCDFRKVVASGPIDLTEAELRGGLDLANAVVWLDRRRRPWSIATRPTPTHARRTAIGMRLSRIGQHVALRSVRVIAGKQQKALDLEFARVQGSVYVDANSNVEGQLDLRARVDKDVKFHDSVLTTEQRPPVDPSDPKQEPQPHPCLRMTGAVIEGQFEVSHCELLAGELNLLLDLESASILGSVTIHEETLITGGIDLRSKVGGQVKFSNTVIVSDGQEPVLSMESAIIAESIFIQNSNIKGRIDARARVGGQVVISHTKIRTQNKGPALTVESATIEETVLIDEDTEIVGGVDLRASVGGHVVISGATITSSESEPALNMESARVGASVYLDESTEIWGGVDLRANISGGVEISDAKIFKHEWDQALTMEWASVAGAILISDSYVEGEVRVTMATLRGGVWGISKNSDKYGDWRRTEFDEQDPHTTIDGTLDLDFAEVDGPVLLHHVIIKGKLLMRHAVVRGDFQACAGKIEGTETTTTPDLPLLDLRAAQLDGRLWLKRQQLGQNQSKGSASPTKVIPTQLPRVDLEDARIQGEANFTKATIYGDLFLRGATVVGRVFGDERNDSGPYPQVTGTVDARGAKLSEVDILFPDDENPMPQGSEMPRLVRLDDATTRVFTVRGLPPVTDKKKPQLSFTVNNLRFEELDVQGLSPDKRELMTWRDWVRVIIWGELVTIVVVVWLLNKQTHRSDALYWALVGYLLLASVAAASSEVGRCVLAALGRKGGNIGARLATMICFFCLWAWQPAWGCVAAVGGLACVGLWWWMANQGDSEKTLHAQLKTLMDRTHFSAGFYLGVERWLRGKGDDPTADHIFLERRRRELEPIEHLPPENVRKRLRPYGFALRAWRWGVLDFMFGYGVRPTRAVHLYLLLLLINWGVFLEPLSVERPLTYVMVPGPIASWEREGIVGWEGKTRKLLPQELGRNPYLADGGHPGPGEWSAENAFFIALRLQVPLLELMSEAEWEPSSRPMQLSFWGEGIKYENYGAAMQTLNLLLLPLTIAGATGFLKQKG